MTFLQTDSAPDLKSSVQCSLEKILVRTCTGQSVQWTCGGNVGAVSCNPRSSR